MDVLNMGDSIFDTINKLIGGEENGDYFAPDLVAAINTSLAALTQLGVGPKGGFAITSNETTWHDFLGEDNRLNMVVTCVYLRTKLIFDPPSGGALREVMETQLKELEWRAMIAADPVSYGDAG